MQCIAPGIWRLRLGVPESLTPITFREIPPRVQELAAMTAVAACPIAETSVQWSAQPRGSVVEIPAVADEQFFGLGLQLKSFNQTGLKKTLRVNSDPVADTGDSHAPVPFFISSAGYGIYVDTARYASFYLGSHTKPGASSASTASTPSTIASSTEELYAQRRLTQRTLILDIPAAQGVDLYIIAGPTPMDVVRRYNLFSGGGCLPPLWGLGIWYRATGQANQDQAAALATSLRQHQLPCDVFGLEPGWQSKAYSCSFAWSPERFPRPDQLLGSLRQQGFNVNLWEHVFVHPASPIYPALIPHAGEYEVWGGLVPDLSVPQARAAFGDYHRTQLIDKGITGFKLDECDNSDFIRSPWSFPEASRFPSGLDGEQMHSLLGMLYQRTIYDGFTSSDVRTYSAVRNAGALAAPYPFVLYSDLYDHRDFIRGLVNSGFSGILWTPEVRHATSPEELLRRIQSVIFSPQALVNAWYIKNPPWLQFDIAKNNNDELLDNAQEIESAVRKLFRLRMSLIPYLYAAFARYHFQGIPPFRALVLDYPDDVATHQIDDQYLMGDDLLVAPMFAGQTERKVYLPPGQWYDFHTHAQYAGGQTYTISADVETIPVFVRSGAILPLAEPVEHVAPDTVFRIVATTFGPAESLRPTTLFEDDGVSFAFQSGDFARLTLCPDRTTRREGSFATIRHQVVAWKSVL